MKEIAGQRSQLPRGAAVHPLSQITVTLAEHYRRKKAFYAVNTPRTYDRDLHRIFTADPKYRTAPTAAAFIRLHRSHFRQIVARWTGEYQLTLDSVLDDMIDRCRELKLRAPGPERQLLTDFTVLLTAKTVHSLYSPSRRQWFAL
jgi:hypothetical protein